jgi:hypothetical protein
MAISGEQMTNVLAFDGALVGSEGWIWKWNLVDSTLPPVWLDISGSGSTSNTPSASFLARNNWILSFVVSGWGGNYWIQESINDQDRTNIVRLGVSAGFWIVKIKKWYYYRGICDKQSGVEIIWSPVSLIYSI